MFIEYVLFDKYEIIQSKDEPVNPIDLIISIRILWSKLSKAHERSRSINCTESELSKYLSISSEILSSLVSVLWPGLYAFWYSSKRLWNSRYSIIYLLTIFSIILLSNGNCDIGQ